MTGKVVVITGGASGIGRATALAFGRHGTKVIIGDVDLAGAKDTVASIRDKGGEADCLQVDVTKSTDVQAMVARAVAQYGGLDFAFNNAGLVGPVVGVVDTSEEDWAHVVATNLTGMWLCMKYEIPEMLKQGKGAIVNNGSVTGLIGVPGGVAGVSSKHGVTGLLDQIGCSAIRYAGNPSERSGPRECNALQHSLDLLRPTQLLRPLCCRWYRKVVCVNRKRLQMR